MTADPLRLQARAIVPPRCQLHRLPTASLARASDRAADSRFVFERIHRPQDGAGSDQARDIEGPCRRERPPAQSKPVLLEISSSGLKKAHADAAETPRRPNCNSGSVIVLNRQLDRPKPRASNPSERQQRRLDPATPGFPKPPKIFWMRSHDRKGETGRSSKSGMSQACLTYWLTTFEFELSCVGKAPQQTSTQRTEVQPDVRVNNYLLHGR